MTPGEIDRIAAAINMLRPDWPAASLRTLLARQELVHRPRRDVAVALAWVACESATLTPARVLEAGPWWRAAVADEARTPTPPRRDESCLTCGKRLDACICGERRTRPTRSAPPTPAYTAARRALATREES